MTVIKWFAGAFVGLLFLLALAILLVPMFVDPNDFRGEISSVVKQQTGRDLRLDGELKISVFPWLGIRTQGLSLSQPEQIGGDMVTVEKAQLRLKLLPLISKQLEIDTVVLEKPTLNLITLVDGTSSFTGLVAEEVASDPGASTPTPVYPTNTEASQNTSDSGAASAVALVVQGVEITDANVLWDDRQTGQNYQVADFSLTTGNLLGSSPAAVEMSGSVIDASNPEPIKLSLSGEARIDKDTFDVDVEGLSATIKQAQQQLRLGFDSLRFAQNERLEINAFEFAADALLPAPEGSDNAPQAVTASGEVADLAMQFTGGNPGQVDVSGLQINSELGERGFNIASSKVSANIDKQTVELGQLSVASEDLEMALSDLAVRQFIDAPAATGSINIKPFNAAALLRDLGIDYEPTDNGALQSVALSAKFSGGTAAVSVQNLVFKLDGSTLEGSLAAKDFDNLTTEFDLSLDSLNLDGYLPVADVADEQAETAIEGTEALAIPLAAFKAINANGSFRAGQLISGGLKLENIDVDVVSENGRLTVTPKADLYEGSIGGNLAFQESGDQASLKLKNKIDLVSLGQMLTDADITEQLSGIGSVDIDLTVTEQGGVQTNQGVIKLSAKNGAIQGVDIKKMLDTAYSTFKQYSASSDEGGAAEGEVQEASSSDETRFAELAGTFHLQNYKIKNDDFSLKAPLFRVLGEGEIDIASQTLDYLVKVAVVGTTDGQGGKAIDELSGITIPIRLRGDLSAPGYSLDLKALYRSFAKRELDKKKGQFLQDELGIEGGEKLSTKELLKGALLKGLSKDEEEAPSEPVPYEQTNDQSNNESAQSSQPASVSDDQATATEEPKRELTKKERREERKRKLIEGLFK